MTSTRSALDANWLGACRRAVAGLEQMLAQSPISDERGEIDYGDPHIRVIVDPIDGSLNAKRGLPHHALSIAVAEGDTMADVVFAFVHDFGPSEEWSARRGEGAWLDGRRLDPAL